MVETQVDVLFRLVKNCMGVKNKWQGRVEGRPIGQRLLLREPLRGDMVVRAYIRSRVVTD
jgi:hypothetical protein